MHNHLTLPKAPDDEPWDRIYTCCDEKKTVQAIAFVQHERHFVSYLATHPDNLSHPVNDSVPRIRGAATEILRHLAAISQRDHKPLRLEAMPATDTTEGNRDFYIRLGFKRVTGMQAREREESTGGLIPMVLRRRNPLIPS